MNEKFLDYVAFLFLNIMDEINQDAMSSQGDSSATIGTDTSLQDNISNLADEFSAQNNEEQNSFDAEYQQSALNAEPAETDTDTQSNEESNDNSEEKDEVSQLLEDTKGNENELIKKLRASLKESSQNQKHLQKSLDELSTQEQQGNIFDQITEFDLSKGVPTAKSFINKLYEQDANLAEQLFTEMSDLELSNGQTLGHQFLKDNGLDPSRIEDYRNIDKLGTDYNAVVPAEIPEEYREAFKSLSDLNKDKVMDDLEDAGLEKDKTKAKAFRDSALQTLQNAQNSINNNKKEIAEAEAQQQEAIKQATERFYTSVDETYSNVFETLQTGTNFTNTKLDSNEVIDQTLKQSFVSNLMSLADTDSVIGKQAVQNLETIGVNIDQKEIADTLSSIDTNLEIIAMAGEKYPAEAAKANRTVADMQGKLVALGNKYLVQYANFINKQRQGSQSDVGKNAGMPIVSGTGANAAQNGQKRLSIREKALGLAQEFSQ